MGSEHCYLYIHHLSCYSDCWITPWAAEWRGLHSPEISLLAFLWGDKPLLHPSLQNTLGWSPWGLHAVQPLLNTTSNTDFKCQMFSGSQQSYNDNQQKCCSSWLKHPTLSFSSLKTFGTGVACLCSRYIPVPLSSTIHDTDYSLGQRLSAFHPDLQALSREGIGSWFSLAQCEELITRITAEPWLPASY